VIIFGNTVLIPQTEQPSMQKEQEFVRIIKENEGVIFKITTLYTDTRIKN